jgi:hypothetical protein
MIIARLEKPILGNRILGLITVTVGPPSEWRFVFKRCRWICDERGERIELPCGPFQFLGFDEAERFQRTVLHAAREHAAFFPLSHKERRKFSLWQ